MSIEGFRTLNQDIETIINKSNHVKNVKKEGDEKLNPKEKRELTDEEREYKSKRKEIQEKLIKFATRIPVFMYLTDYRERCLKDVITQLEPGLFKKVTGLAVKDFELLCSLGVFNASLMNDAIFKFKRYEDSSLSYTGIDKHANKDVGGWDTVIKREEYEKLFFNQQITMNDIKEIVEQPVLSKADTVVSSTKKSVVDQFGSSITMIENKKTELLPNTDVDLSKTVVGAIVNHRKFGDGEILSIDKLSKYLTVKFTEGEKKFAFPGAFTQGFLSFKE